MGFKGYRKLIDVPHTRNQFNSNLRFHLSKHKIPYRESWHGTGDSAFRRYFVEPENSCCALSIVQALTVSVKMSPVKLGPSNNPLERLPFPVRCEYPGCDAGLLFTATQVDEHITEEHLPQAIWTFAEQQMRGTKQ